jgi:hypothetical protein
MSNFTQPIDGYLVDNFDFDNLLDFNEIAEFAAEPGDDLLPPSNNHTTLNPNYTLNVSPEHAYDIYS